MSRQPKLRPKSHIPGLTDGFYDLAAVAPLTDLEPALGVPDEKREQRVFRVKRKHVLKACDRCRVKKTKCDGKQPCNRCSAYNHPCLFRERKATQTKVYSRGFVEMLESHHLLVVKALQKLYKHCLNKEGFPGEPLVEAAGGHPLTHAILDRLGLIKQAEETTDEPDEDTEDLRYLRLLSTSTDSSATEDPSPEPPTPSDPSPTSCHPVNPSAAGPPWKWDFQPVHTEQYHTYHDAGYHDMLIRPPVGPARLATEASGPEPAPSAPNHEHSYLYCLDGGCNDSSPKNRIHPGVMAGPGPSPVSAGLPVDMLGEYHVPLQGQPLYSAPPPPGPCWNFSSV